MTTPTLTPVTNSSQIIGAGYDAATKVLALQFTGGATYTYADVPHDVAIDFALAATESPGKAFDALIRGKYTTTKLPAEPAATET